MLDTAAADALLDRQAERGYVFPAYEEACFADISEAALSVLSTRFQNDLPSGAVRESARDVDHVVVLLIDGLGWDQWGTDRHGAAFLDTLTEHGRVTPLTSIFPSETAAAVTTINTGVSPIEHGLLGWHAYLSEIDESVYTLPFETRDGEPIDDVHEGADADLLFDAEPIYSDAEAAGIDTHVIQPVSTADSVYSRAVFGPATDHTYGTLPELGVTLRHHLEACSGPTYTYVYVPHIDTAAHAVGTTGDVYDATVSTIGHVLQRALVSELDSTTAARTLLLTTADHGHVNTGPATRVNLEIDLGGISEHLDRRPTGDPIPPQGGPRDLQFHVREGHVEQLRERLETAMPCVTFDREEYLDRCLFGGASPSRAFERRAPDLVAVHRDSAVWDEPAGLEHVGVHGGLTRAEMLIPLATARLDRLRD